MHTSQKTNTNNSLLQKETKETTYNSLLPSSTDNISLATKRTSLTSQNTKISNTIIKNKPTTRSQNTIIKAKTIHTPPNILPLTKIHKYDIFDPCHNSLATIDNMNLNTNQQDNIDLAKKQMQTINRTTQNWLKVENKEVIHEEFPPYESIIINHRNHQLIASPIKKCKFK